MADTNSQIPGSAEDPLVVPESSTTADLVEPPAPKPKSKAVWPGAVLGGALAALAGYGLAQFVPGGWPIADTSALSTQIADQRAASEALKTEIARLSESVASTSQSPDPALADRLTALETAVSSLPAPADISPILARIDVLETTVQAFAALPTDGSGASAAAVAALKAEVDALKGAGSALPAEIEAATAAAEARIAEVEKRAQALQSDAEKLLGAATTRAALGQLRAALDTGLPFAAALTDLPADSLQAVLIDNAEAGLPTLAALQGTFPEAARLALEAALRANMGESWTERVSAFLRNQTGARSLTPREGTDPDAVLSRTEAALADGDLTTTLTEMAALPAEGLAAMAPWQVKAELRLAAIEAVNQVAKAVGE